MTIIRTTLFTGLVAVALLGVPGAYAAEPDPSGQTTDDEDTFVAGGGACSGASTAAGLLPIIFAIGGTVLRRRR